MSRTTLWIMTIFLSLAMIALVAVQTYWIKHSIESEENQLGLAVNKVLSEMSEELVQNETVLNILEEIHPPVIQHQSRAIWNFQIDSRSSLSKDAKEEIHVDENVQMNEEIIVFTPPHQSLKNQKIELIDDSVLVVLGEDELLHDTILISAMNPDQIRTELNKSLKKQEELVNKVIKKMLVEEENITDRISASQIKSLLQRKLSEKDVHIAFEYAVYEEGKKPIFQSDNFSEYDDSRYFRSTLFPGGIFNKPTLI